MAFLWPGVTVVCGARRAVRARFAMASVSSDRPQTRYLLQRKRPVCATEHVPAIVPYAPVIGVTPSVAAAANGHPFGKDEIR